MSSWWNSLWASDKSADDPLRKLDPKLREFLEKESPVKYNAPGSQPTPQPPAAPAQQQKAPAAAAAEEDDDGKPVVPRESLFQDGRYAHLWKGYKSLAQVEAETKSDHERLMDVLEGYKERKVQIGKAALENCALEQVDWRSCMMNPDMTERFTLCRTQVRKFERCYATQTRLLKTLGYLSSYERAPEVEEEIQMHADTLYHRMMAQEAEIAQAKEEGRPVPTFAPLISRKADGTTATTSTAAANANAPTTTSTNTTTTPSSSVAAATSRIEEEELGWGGAAELTPEKRQVLRDKLKDVAEEDRAAEAEAIKAEWRAKAEVADRVEHLWRQQERERRERRDRGEETYWDRLADAFNRGGGGGGGGGDKK
ncbi:hypothetical protein GGR56DRAFT_649766 [Xylariaceae sp. FL0804]|nr:hypothetical protein GGR56DRAFT_649766 [Xylariaceae sp. FL0804]